MGVDHGGRSLGAALPGRQGRLLFAYLVLNRDRDCGRGELIDLLWPEKPPAAADTALSALLSKLRRTLGDGTLAGRSELRLTLEEPIEVDVEAAATATVRAEAAIDARDWPAAAAAAREVLTVDLQTFLPDCEGPWVNEARRELETVRVRALEVLAEAGLHQGGRELGAAEQAARAAIAAAPFRESAHRLLMEVHDAAGNPAEALRAFEELRILLRDELGTTPGAAAMAVHERLLRGDELALASAAPPEPVPVVGWPAPLAAALDRQALVGRRQELGAARGVTGATRSPEDGSSCSWPATPASARRGSPPSSRGARATTARSSSTAASTRRRSPPTSRWSRWCAAGRRAPRSSRCASAWACARPTSGCCSASSARRRPTRRATRTRGGCASSTRLRRCSGRPARRRRSC